MAIGRTNEEPGRPHILVAFQTVPIARLLERHFLKEGYQVLFAWDGDDALQKIKTGAVDLAILDSFLPPTDGFEVVKCMKADATTAKIPVIFIHTRGLDGDAVIFRYFRSGASCFLTAPFNPMEIILFLRRVFEPTILPHHESNSG